MRQNKAARPGTSCRAEGNPAQGAQLVAILISLQQLQLSVAQLSALTDPDRLDRQGGVAVGGGTKRAACSLPAALGRLVGIASSRLVRAASGTRGGKLMYMASRFTAASASSAAVRSSLTWGMVASSARPQVFLAISRNTYPSSPQVEDQELRTIGTIQ